MARRGLEPEEREELACGECNGHGYVRIDHPGLERYGIDPESEECEACRGTGLELPPDYGRAA